MGDIFGLELEMVVVGVLSLVWIWNGWGWGTVFGLELEMVVDGVLYLV